jgi:microcystin-dependent protein
MMAALAIFRDDIGAPIATSTTSGGPVNYVLTSAGGGATGQPYTSLTNLAGKLLSFVPNVSCAAGSSAAPITLAVDGLTAKPLRPSPSVELLAGQIIQGTPYIVSYNGTDGAFYLYNTQPGAALALPLGSIMPYAGTTAPTSSFAICQGQGISRATYASLFSLIGTTYGNGDGGSGSTFGLPDLRGRVIAGLDATNPGGAGLANRIGNLVTDSGTIVGSMQGSVGGSQSHTQTTNELFNHAHTQQGTFGFNAGSVAAAHAHTFTYENVAAAGSTGGATVAGGHGTSTGATDASTTLTLSGNVTISGATVAAGGLTGVTQAMAWLQPTIILPFIIRVL